MEGLKMNEKFDHTRTNEIVCPYCGYEYSDSIEYVGNNGDGHSEKICCDSCGKLFEYVFELTATFSTEKLEDE